MLNKQRLPSYFSRFAMPAIVLLAVLFRLFLILSDWPEANSDEATIGLMALHIAYKGELPIFFYGQGYMGALQAYLGAITFRVFGPSFVSLHLVTLLIFGLYLLSMYHLTRFLYTHNFALLVIAVLSLGSDRMIGIPLSANGGYAETMLFGALIFLLAAWLAVTMKTTTDPSRRRIYGLLGLLMGVATWSDHLIAPAVCTAVLLLLLCCRREVLGKDGLIGLGGCLIGLLPVVLYNLSPPPGQDTIHSVAGTFTAGGSSVPLQDRLLHTLLISQPLATGLPFTTSPGAICPTHEPYHTSLSSISALFPDTPNPITCVVLRGGWSLIEIVLWALAVAGIVRWLYKHHSTRQNHPLPEVATEGEATTEAENDAPGRARVLQYARLMLLVSALLWFCLFATSTAAAVTPRASSRYLICLLFATPAILWPLWRNIHHLRLQKNSRQRRGLPLSISSASILLALFAVYLCGVIEIVGYLPAAQAMRQQQQQLVRELLRLKITRVYTEYWTCNVLIFQSNERIICSNLDEHLQPYLDRYPPYREIVHKAKNPAYVFPIDSEQDQAFKMRMDLNRQYQVVTTNGYVIYYKKT